MSLGIPVICSINASVEIFTDEVVYIPEKMSLIITLIVLKNKL